jgi:hypothetical protein
MERVLEPWWEEGIDAIYQLREEQGADIALAARKRQPPAKPPVVAAAVSRTAIAAAAPAAATPVAVVADSAAVPVASSSKKQLPLHVARSLADSELSMRHETTVAGDGRVRAKRMRQDSSPADYYLLSCS